MKNFKLALFCLSAAVFTFSCTKNNPAPDRKPPVVNAGSPQTISLPVDSVLLTGTVTDADSKVVGYLWSEVSGPNVPVIASEGSLSTKIHGLTAGSYVFQLMATDTFGLTGVDTVTVTVNPPATITLIGNANDLTESQFLGGSGYDAGNGSTAELGAETWTISSNTVAVRAAFKFDLSSLPALPIKSAKLTLFSNPTPGTGNLSTPNAGTANAFYIQRITTPWNPATAIWSTQPLVDVSDEVLIPHTNSPTLDLVGVDVTTMVKNMITNGNNGFMIRLQTEAIYNSRIFCSGAYSDATKHPQLVISY